MKKSDKFKWATIISAAIVLLATVILAFIAPVYLITLWIGFVAGYTSIRSLVLYVKEREKEIESEETAVPELNKNIPLSELVTPKQIIDVKIDDKEKTVESAPKAEVKVEEPKVDLNVKKKKDTKEKSAKKATNKTKKK